MNHPDPGERPNVATGDCPQASVRDILCGPRKMFDDAKILANISSYLRIAPEDCPRGIDEINDLYEQEIKSLRRPDEYIIPVGFYVAAVDIAADEEILLHYGSHYGKSELPYGGRRGSELPYGAETRPKGAAGGGIHVK